MKWNILVGSLVLGLGLSTQSFGMDLLDRMLGMNYNGGCDKASCCETVSCDPGPSCGCETGCDAVALREEMPQDALVGPLARLWQQESELLRAGLRL